MAFNCVQSFNLANDACFLEMQRIIPRADTTLNQINLKYDCSKIFHSFRDSEKHLKH